MSRPLRLQFEGALYHAMSRGNERKPIFRDDQDRNKFLEILGDAQKTYGLIIHAYVLMTNHYHFLLETPHANLSLAMRQINGVYTRYYNWRWKRSGHLFQSRFKSLLVDKDSYLLTLTRYIHQNPLKAKLVRRLEDYPWSSYRVYAGLAQAPSWLFLEDTLVFFESIHSDGNLSYADFVSERQELNPWTQATAGLILGTADFIDKMKARVQGKISQDTEYSRRQQLACWCDPDFILKSVCQAYGIMLEDLTGGRYHRLEARSLSMYLLREKGGLSLTATAQKLNLSYAGVSKAIARLKKKSGPQDRWQNQMKEVVEFVDKSRVKT
ncbi:MAG: transposase [Elusimicrobia bacterium]|nr:transposase [Elusimicrobiota bacterium]